MADPLGHERSSCIFCRIVDQDLPSDPVLLPGESDSVDGLLRDVYAFRDINPAMPVHVLVVPRDHIESADVLESSHAGVLARMFEAAQAVARRSEVAASGYRLVFNVGDDALNSVAHLHLHVLGGRPMGWPPG